MSTTQHKGVGKKMTLETKATLKLTDEDTRQVLRVKIFDNKKADWMEMKERKKRSVMGLFLFVKNNSDIIGAVALIMERFHPQKHL